MKAQDEESVMTEEKSALEKISKLGVSDPKKPTAQEIKTILDAYVRKKELDVRSFEVYKGLIDSSLRTIFDGFTAFSKDETHITASTLDILKQALDVLRDELRKELSSDERRHILDRVFDLVREAREESRESRKHKRGIINAAVACVAFVVGGMIVLAKGKK